MPAHSKRASQLNRGVSENPDFPRHGKNCVAFSTPWKKLFHTVENPDF